MQYVRFFNDISLKDVLLVGGKNASLGYLLQELSGINVPVAQGFAITTDAYRYYLEHNRLSEHIKTLLRGVDSTSSLSVIRETGLALRTLLQQAEIPHNLAQEIKQAYKELSLFYQQESCSVAVRSSATAEDSPDVSYAGQHDTFLNVTGSENLIIFYKKCVASLFTDRALMYRLERKLDTMNSTLSVGVQKMIRSDLACAGTAFTVDTESGFRDAIVINGSWGLGQIVVQGEVKPDEFCVHKTMLAKKYKPIIKKEVGNKGKKIIFDGSGIQYTKTSLGEQEKFCLSDEEILQLARMCITIEEHYSRYYGSAIPMDIEWAKDGIDGIMYIVQARPETIHGKVARKNIFVEYTLESDAPKKIIAQGSSIGSTIVSGNVRIIKNFDRNILDAFNPGDIVVTMMTDPDWVPLMKKAGALITQEGGRTSHAAIVSRELGITALVGVKDALHVFHEGQEVTVDCSQGQRGFVYEGIIPYEKNEVVCASVASLPCKILLNCADPDTAFRSSFLPVHGVGLMRIEFIMSNVIGIHPMAVLHPEKITNQKVLNLIKERSKGYADAATFFIEALSQGIGMIAGAFYPREVIVRFSDFKSNEYRNLLGGEFFEPKEENPMLGLRGASRYYNPLYQEAFALECKALDKVRSDMGFSNVKVMIPFVRTVSEAHKVLELMKLYNLEKNTHGLEVYMMCEIPSNVILIDEFSRYFDGFSIGSNDLTQTTLAVDRDSRELADLFSEKDPAVLKMFSLALQGARRNKRKSGICGQGPSDYPEIADFLIQEGIDSISLNRDVVIPFFKRYIKKR